MGLLALTRDRAPDTQKNTLKPWQKQAWCIPEVSAEFVAAMEDVLDLYEEPYDPQRPKVNFDETSKQLIAETRTPLPPRPGQPERYDYEYQRNGTRNLFILCEPQAGWRHIAVTAQRTMRDFGHQMQWLVDERFPDTEVVRVIMDNLNTHKPASLYETFEPPEARRILKRLEFHYTPKHGSWLNMAEIELSVLTRQCLNRRIPDEETLTQQINAYEERRNAAKATIDWHFTSREARVKLHRLYPSMSS
jgi:transposase